MNERDALVAAAIEQLTKITSPGYVPEPRGEAAAGNLDLIFRAACDVADGYARHYGDNPPRPWMAWSASAQDDFWSSGQDDLGIPREMQIALPDSLCSEPTD